jgi:hypothetical protein
MPELVCPLYCMVLASTLFAFWWDVPLAPFPFPRRLPLLYLFAPDSLVLHLGLSLFSVLLGPHALLCATSTSKIPSVMHNYKFRVEVYLGGC